MENQPIKREEEFFGKKVIITMDRDGSYSASVDGQVIEFLPWALEQKKMQQSQNQHE
jgi:hypothetical protein